ncbi:hypothetical protein [Boudabousia marimammalium]|uniref:Cell division protein FtsL n=1 Tax=Boudabousia marimammalium TaxID=156892 RepID=A0A1Q5PNZ8_9ACTO|nr:hypothetical protein [Boudabousia marimammalium]OKL49247.1 hypothetical protein BM477_04465 [Boudabousia marimammalium]
MSAVATARNTNLRAQPSPRSQREQAPQLAVIPTVRPRTSGAITVAVMLIGAIAMVAISLFISTLLAHNALGMGELQSELKVLQEQNQAYTEQLNELSSSVSLSQRAQELGMVANTNFGYVNLETGEIGNGSPAR